MGAGQQSKPTHGCSFGTYQQGGATIDGCAPRRLLTEGLLDANRVVVGIALAIVALATLAYLLRRLWR